MAAAKWNISIETIVPIGSPPLVSGDDSYVNIYSYGVQTSVNDGNSSNDTLISPEADNGNVTEASSWFVSLNYSRPTMIVVAVVLFVVIVLTVFGNTLVAVALFRFRSLRTVSNFLIGNLALSDFLLATTVLPLSTVNECLGHWVFGRAACNVWLLVDVLCCTASLWNICIIALDRFTATLYPIWYRERRSSHQALLYVAIVWALSSAVCLPPLLGWNDLSNNYVWDNATSVHRCILFQTRSYVLYSASMSFFVPFFLTVFLYVQIFVVLRERMRKMRGSSSSSVVGTTVGSASSNQAASAGDGCQRGTKAIVVSAGAANKVQQRDDNKLLLPPETIAPDGITGNVDSSITVVELATFNASASGARRSTDQTSLRSLCSDVGVGGSVIQEESSMKQCDGNGTTIDVISPVTATTIAECADDQKTTSSSSTGGSGCLDFVRQLIGTALSPSTSSSKATCRNGSRSAAASNGLATSGNRRFRAVARRRDPGPEAAACSDDNDVRTALMATCSSSAPGTPEVQSSAVQRRRQRFRRFVQTAGNSVFRSSTSSMSTDPRGATVRTSAARRFEQREMQATIRMAIIIAFFCGMWLGFFTVYVIQSWCPATICPVPRALDAFFFWLGYSNSSINPILYTIFNDDFRRAFRKLVSCRVKGGSGGRDQFTGSRVIDRHGARDVSINCR